MLNFCFKQGIPPLWTITYPSRPATPTLPALSSSYSIHVRYTWPLLCHTKEFSLKFCFMISYLRDISKTKSFNLLKYQSTRSWNQVVLFYTIFNVSLESWVPFVCWLIIAKRCNVHLSIICVNSLNLIRE